MLASALSTTPLPPRDLGAVQVVVDGPWLAQALSAVLFARHGRAPPRLCLGPGNQLFAHWSRPRRRAAGFDVADGADDAELLLLTARTLAPNVLCELDRRTAAERPELFAIADDCWLAAPADRPGLLRAAAWLARQEAAKAFVRCRRRVVVDARNVRGEIADRTALQALFRPAAVYFAAEAAPDWLDAVA